MSSMNITVGQYVKGNSFLHRLDPRLKMLSTILLMVAIFLIPTNGMINIYVLLGILALFLILFLVARISLLAIIKGLQPVLFVGLFTFVLQIMYNPTGEFIGNVSLSFSWLSILVALGIVVVWFLTSKYVAFKGLYMLVMIASVIASLVFIPSNYEFYVYPFNIYSDGLLKGIFFVLRIVLIIMLSSMLTMTTSTTDINLGLEWVLYPLKLIKVPVSELSMMLSLTLRFIPTLLIETEKIMKAQASRGIDFNEGSLVEKIKQIVTLLIPMFFLSITRAEDLANAMEARGYIVGGKRTSIDELKFGVKDIISAAFVILLLAGIIVIRVLQ